MRAWMPRVLLRQERCLRKDRRQRIRDIGDVRLALEGAFDAGAGDAAPRTEPATPPKRPEAKLPKLIEE